MAATNLEIINLALAKIGSATISDWNDATKEGRTATSVFTNNREWLQEKFPWNFCLNRIYLTSASTGYGLTASGFTAYSTEYTYYWPMSTVTDCLRIYELVGEPLVKYLVEGGYLYTDDNTIAVRYIKKSTDPTKFPPAFTNCLALAIAMEIASILTGDMKLRLAIKNEFLEEIEQAYLLNAIEGRTRVGKGSRSLDITGATWQEER